MCSYKLVSVSFDVWALASRVESFVHKVSCTVSFVYSSVEVCIYQSVTQACSQKQDLSSANRSQTYGLSISHFRVAVNLIMKGRPAKCKTFSYEN